MPARCHRLSPAEAKFLQALCVQAYGSLRAALPPSEGGVAGLARFGERSPYLRIY